MLTPSGRSRRPLPAAAPPRSPRGSAGRGPRGRRRRPSRTPGDTVSVRRSIRCCSDIWGVLRTSVRGQAVASAGACRRAAGRVGAGRRPRRTRGRPLLGLGVEPDGQAEERRRRRRPRRGSARRSARRRPLEQEPGRDGARVPPAPTIPRPSPSALRFTNGTTAYVAPSAIFMNSPKPSITGIARLTACILREEHQADSLAQQGDEQPVNPPFRPQRPPIRSLTAPPSVRAKRCIRPSDPAAIPAAFRPRPKWSA